MTQKERQARSKHMILQAAMKEFGNYNYEDVTMEKICSRHRISKGMMYHYYENKDALFLECAREVFDQLKAYIARDAETITDQDALVRTRNYFLIREYYFNLYPMQKNIFENAVFRAPKHLKSAIWELRRPIREMNRQFLWQTILKLQLRPNIQQAVAARYIESIEHVFWELLDQFNTKNQLSDLHEVSIVGKQLLDMVFFGIVRQPYETERSQTDA